ncbi:uncharacterized protein LOC133176420 [Saccostrea echinata]|uniref:uncharacterized protein LOC133176420 n=1 Tax=Saccostrea echinata TaxID=191078 RepID=UPI002A80BBC1|nr:uncharacterized protein LOC133176420 [Saccostrea echinata]
MKKHLCIIFTVLVLVGAYIEEIDLPESFTECLEKQRIKNQGAASWEAMNKWCMNSHRMKLTGDKFKHANVSQDTVSWINELLRMSNVDMKLDLHSINKRQADNPSLYPNVQFPPQPIITDEDSQTSNTQNSQGPEYQSETLQSFVNQHTGSSQAQRFQPGQTRPFPIIGGNPQPPSQSVVQTQQQVFQGSVQQQPLAGQNQPIQTQASQIQTNPVQNQFSQQSVVQQSQQAVNFAPPQQPQAVNFASSQQSSFVQPQQPTFVQPQQPAFVQTQQNFQPVNAFQPQPTVMSPTMSAAQPTGIPQVQRPQLRIRKEYRTMTEQERANFHRAILLLKQDTTIRPNRYDALGLVHFRMVDNIHHGGAFLAWHRIFITIFENALRQMVPGVTLPYWDSTMDEAMIDPTQSVTWSPQFLGNGDGLVTNGPFAFWQTPNGPLIRNIGQDGQLLSRQAIRNILTRTRMGQITEPAAPDQFNIENYHGDAHTWIGGQMEPMETSAFDPVFYLHHAFVDYVWEIFRQQQRAMGIDPTQDYPQNYGPQSHAPFTPTGFGNLPNVFGISDMFTSQIYTYQPHPTCSFQNSNCGSPYLTCDLSTGVPQCLPISSGPPPAQLRAARMRGVPGVMGAGPRLGGMPLPFGRKKREATKDRVTINAKSSSNSYHQVMVKQMQCSNTWVSFSSQNTFEIDNEGDTRKWVFIPVRVVNKRSPEHRKFKAYAIIDGKPSVKADIYDPEQYQEIKPYFSEELMPSSEKCKTVTGDRTVGRIHIRSNGLNYQGNYDEYVIVDLRQAFTESTTYIGLKSPGQNDTEVLLSAYDSCGRKCQAFCRSRDKNSPGFHPCSGALRVNNNTPWEYGKNYGDAVRMSWDLNDLYTIPELQNQSVFIQFFCDHRE